MSIIPFPAFRTSFKFTVETTGSNETFSLPLVSDGSYNIKVLWGDGGVDTITAYNQAEVTHNYVSAGAHNITMSGVCTKFTFDGTGDCAKVKRVSNFSDLGFTALNFSGCTNLSSISPSMKRLTHLTTANSMFSGCSALTTIPAGIFDGSKGIASFESVFLGCNQVTSIPTDLFRYNVNATTFQYALYEMSALTTIPVDIFRYNTATTNFTATFYNDIALTSLPNDIFRYNILAQEFTQVLRSCVNLTSVPDDLFRYNTAGVYWSAAFMNCLKLQLKTNMFCASGDEDERFLNQSPSFDGCFHLLDTFTGTQGTAPALWDYSYGTGTPTTTNCFAGHSTSSLTNYGDVPTAWKS